MDGRADCVGSIVADGALAQPAWANRPANFDNILQAMFLLYEMSTENDWVVKAYDGMDARGVDLQPKFESHTHWCLFFLLFIVISNFFFLNLFVGVRFPPRDPGNPVCTKRDQTGFAANGVAPYFAQKTGSIPNVSRFLSPHAYFPAWVNHYGKYAWSPRARLSYARANHERRSSGRSTWPSGTKGSRI